MEPVKLLKNLNIKGLCIYCTTCKSKIKDKCGSTKKKISSCSEKVKHKYKVIVYVPGKDNVAKTKLLDTRDPNEAILQAFAYRAELEKTSYSSKLTATKTKLPRTIVDAMAYYVSFINNDTPHEQEHKQRTKGHLDEVERYFGYFIEYLHTMEVDPSIYPFEKLDKNLVGKLKSYLLETRNYAPKTYNKYIGLMRVFVNFMIEEFDFRMKNPFKGFKRLRSAIKINTISNNEFHALLQQITPENGIQSFSNRSSSKRYIKSRYRPWLKNAILLALLTGRRREEVVSMKFNGITENANGEPLTITIEDYKVNRSNDITEKEEVKKIYVPVIAPLRKLLYELGYQENKGKDIYILAPEERMNRKSMMDFISKSFSHFYKQLKTGNDVSFYDLRKTYITHLYVAHGEKARVVTKHSGEDVMIDHYIDEKVIAEVAKDFELFGL